MTKEALRILNGEDIVDTRMLKIINKCIKNMKSWGILIPFGIIWKNACMKDMGRTNWLLDDSENLKIVIQLNKGLGSQIDKTIEDTVYHELSHAATGGGHDAKWRDMIEFLRFKTKLPLLETAKLTDVTNDYWLTGFKYVIRCKKCGQMIGFNTMNDIVRDPGEWDEVHQCSRFHHQGCGGTWERIK